MKISVLIGTRNRPALLLRCIKSIVSQSYADVEIVVLDDASDPAIDFEAMQKAAGHLYLKGIRADTNLGLNRTRNQLIDAASGDIFFVIDDDAYFESDYALQLVADTFAVAPSLGIIATKILDYRGGTMRPLTPHSRREIRRNKDILDDSHLISYFLGGAHAIRRSVIEASGPYDEVLMYGLDEIELAYRVLEKGFEIKYLPQIIVHHKPPQALNNVKSESSWRLYYLTRNRILFAYKHLPMRYALSYVPGWLGFYGFRAIASGLLNVYFKGISDGIKTLKQLDRRPVSNRTVAYLKANYGRLWR